MARNDIRLVIGFHRHLKIRKLHKTLGSDGVLSLLILWMYAAENRKTGLLHGLDHKDIADASEWKGNPRKFVRTLVSIGLLDETDDGTMKIHDWKSHQPYISTADERSEKARTSAYVRWRAAPIKENTEAKRIRNAYGTHNSRNAPSPTPTPTPALRMEGGGDQDPPALSSCSSPSDETKRDDGSRNGLDGPSAPSNDRGNGQHLDQTEDDKDTTTASGKVDPFVESLSRLKREALQYAITLSSNDNGAAVQHLKAARFAGPELSRAVELLGEGKAN